MMHRKSNHYLLEAYNYILIKLALYSVFRSKLCWLFVLMSHSLNEPFSQFIQNFVVIKITVEKQYVMYSFEQNRYYSFLCLDKVDSLVVLLPLPSLLYMGPVLYFHFIVKSFKYVLGLKGIPVKTFSNIIKQNY